VALVTKAKLDETNTSYAQGGISGVMSPPDNFKKHIEDTLIAGDGICDLEAVTKVVARSARKHQATD
jgi:L-aspartate oxidase